MTGCTAPGCTNSDQKGFIMKIFPRDPIRRAQWAKNVDRKGWIPTARSFLCEVCLFIFKIIKTRLHRSFILNLVFYVLLIFNFYT